MSLSAATRIYIAIGSNIEIAPDALHPVRGLPVRLLEKGIEFRQIIGRTAPGEEIQSAEQRSA